MMLPVMFVNNYKMHIFVPNSNKIFQTILNKIPICTSV